MDTLWVLFAAAFVFFMQAGFALLEAGPAGRENVVNGRAGRGTGRSRERRPYFLSFKCWECLASKVAGVALLMIDR